MQKYFEFLRERENHTLDLWHNLDVYKKRSTGSYEEETFN